MKAICVGHTTYDITFPVEGYPAENIKYRIENYIECGGGPASNGAYLLGKWGVDTSIASIVGDDYYGNLLKDEFSSVLVDAKYLELRKDYKTSVSFIVANTKTGSRTIFTSKRKHIRKLNSKITERCDLILIDGEHPDTALEVIENNPDAISVLDAGRLNDDTRRLGKLVNYVICSHDFAEEFTGIKIVNDNNLLRKIYDEISRYFNTNVIITLEGAGSFTCVDHKYVLIPSIKVKSIDSTGAGDIFHGAFLYFIGSGYSLIDSIHYSSITAALSTETIGSRFSIPRLEDVLNYDDII